MRATSLGPGYERLMGFWSSSLGLLGVRCLGFGVLRVFKATSLGPGYHEGLLGSGCEGSEGGLWGLGSGFSSGFYGLG